MLDENANRLGQQRFTLRMRIFCFETATALKTKGPMNEVKLLSELAQHCRRIADYQQNPNVLDMLYDLEQDFGAQRSRSLFAWNGTNIELRTKRAVRPIEYPDVFRTRAIYN
jgi:hypothetical protein